MFPESKTEVFSLSHATTPHTHIHTQREEREEDMRDMRDRALSVLSELNVH